jgi:carboxymethylenebutenolidase
VWNSFKTDNVGLGVRAELTTFKGGNGDEITTYNASPLGNNKRGGIVLVHHLPGWDEFYQEFAERLARHGYDVICPNLYHRYGSGTPEEMAGKVREQGGVHDDSVLADCDAAAAWLRAQPTSNGKVGIIGTCSGGRHSVMVASRSKSFDAVVDCWGGGVVQDPNPPAQPVAPIDMTANLNAPLLGLFGNDDQRPTAADVDKHEAKLKELGKDYEFHRYDGAGHGIFYYQTPLYRPQAAMDCWAKIFGFFEKHLS